MLRQHMYLGNEYIQLQIHQRLKKLCRYYHHRHRRRQY
jgi:hypothetical protein